MSQPPRTAASQNKEAILKGYSKRLKDNVKSMVDNFAGTKQSEASTWELNVIGFNLPAIVALARLEPEGQVSRATQADEDNFEMTVRAANIVRPKVVKSTYSGFGL